MNAAALLAASASLLVLASAPAPRNGPADQGEKKGTLFASSEKGEFKEVLPGVSRSTIWGDPEKGPYGAFTKFKPGFDAGTHTHTNEVRIVVLKGAYVLRVDGAETRVGPGCFLSVPGGAKHWSGGDEKEGALFYEEGAGKFDLLPAK